MKWSEDKSLLTPMRGDIDKMSRSAVVTGIGMYVPEKMLTNEEIEQMLDEYYTERGWDLKTGLPLKDTLKRLGLEKDA